VVLELRLEAEMSDRFITACLEFFHAHLRKAQTIPCEERHWPSTNFLQKADVHCSIAPENLTHVNKFAEIRSNYRSFTAIYRGKTEPGKRAESVLFADSVMFTKCLMFTKR